MSINNLGE